MEDSSRPTSPGTGVRQKSPARPRSANAAGRQVGAKERAWSSGRAGARSQRNLAGRLSATRGRPGLGSSLQHGLSTTANGPNPFSLGNETFLRDQAKALGVRPRSKSPGKKGAGRSSRRPDGSGPEDALRHGLTKIQKGDVERGGQDVKDALLGLPPDKLPWFIKTVFEDRKLVLSLHARRKLLSLLPCVVEQRGPAVLESKDLQQRILPVLVGALEAQKNGRATLAEDGVLTRGLEETVSRAFTDIITTLVPEGEDGRHFSEVADNILVALLDPLVLGAGWDIPLKKRCVRVLSMLTPFLLYKAGTVNDREPVLQKFAYLLMRCLAVNSSMHEGLLMSLEHLASDFSHTLQPHAEYLVELCASHLTETPSELASTLDRRQMLYAPERPRLSDLASTPPKAKRGLLTPKLALACCRCLTHLAEPGLQGQRPIVEIALTQENLNLHRLARGPESEELRHSIKEASQAWRDL